MLTTNLSCLHKEVRHGITQDHEIPRFINFEDRNQSYA
jgi:hypothetical protein